MNYIITCGGTGGHINPAIAIADSLKEKDKSANILFVGNEGGMESTLIPKAEYPIKFVNVSGISRKLTPKNAISVIKALKASTKCSKYIKDFSPDAVIGTGGYVCYPMLRAASKAKIFTAVHESNAIPGLAVRLLKNRMDRIYVNFSESGELLGKSNKILRTGNPQRAGIDPKNREMQRAELGITGKYRYVILSFGGSLGAETVNREMLRLMKSFTSHHPEILHVHATGKLGFEAFMSHVQSSELKDLKNILVSEYIYNLPEWINCADAVICRAGAMTLSELAAAGRASILIPSPNVVDNHQFKNAKAFENAGAAFTVIEEENDLKRIPELVKTILFDRKIRASMEENAIKFALGDASGVIANDIISCVKRRKSHI